MKSHYFGVNIGLWRDNDKSDHGIAFEIMKSTHHSYHYLLRHLKRAKAEITQHKMDNMLLKSNSRSWNKLKKVLNILVLKY